MTVKSVADLGCGIGYTTAALKELFPAATVYGTQILGTFQHNVAAEVGRRKGFAIYPEVTGPTDLIFASEYFEHFQRPIEHLLTVIETCRPKYLVIANSFGSHSIGHFDAYIVGPDHEHLFEEAIPNTAIGRQFNDVLRNGGYQRMTTTF